MNKLWIWVVALLKKEPARVTGVVVAGVVCLLVHFLHVDANAAQQAALAVVPLVVSEIIRGKVTPAEAQSGLQDVLERISSLAATVEAVEGKTAVGQEITRGFNDLISTLQAGVVPLPSATPRTVLPSDGTPPWLAATEEILMRTGPAVTSPAGPVLPG